MVRQSDGESVNCTSDGESVVSTSDGENEFSTSDGMSVVVQVMERV